MTAKCRQRSVIVSSITHWTERWTQQREALHVPMSLAEQLLMALEPHLLMPESCYIDKARTKKERSNLNRVWKQLVEIYKFV
jgi:hypothetical protein